MITADYLLAFINHINRIIHRYNMHLLINMAAHGQCGFEAGAGSQELVADGKGERERAVDTLLNMAPCAGLLEQDANGAMQVGISRAFAHIEIVIPLLGVIERSRPIERFGVEGSDLSREMGRAGWDQRMQALRDAGLEEESGIRSHLMKVKHHVRLPTLVDRHPPLALWVLQRQPSC